MIFVKEVMPILNDNNILFLFSYEHMRNQYAISMLSLLLTYKDPLQKLQLLTSKKMIVQAYFALSAD